MFRLRCTHCLNGPAMTPTSPPAQDAPHASATQFKADAVAVGLSVACLAHCLLLPLLLTLAPALSVGALEDEQFHRWMLVAILPTSAVALFLGCWKHRSLTLVITGTVGLTLLVLAAFFGHDLLGEAGEKILTSIGALIVGFSHIMNYRLCKRMSCDCG